MKQGAGNSATLLVPSEGDVLHEDWFADAWFLEEWFAG